MIRFGAAYYYEYHQPGTDPSLDQLAKDLDLMAKANFTVIRVGESVWSTWEPENGVFELDWLEPVLNGAHERGIGVILGTPTYAIPPWLWQLYPEIAGEPKTGEPMRWGGRQEVDYSHAAFRFHAERLIRKIVGRYAEHPAVIGFQVDNEPGLHLFRNNGIFQQFITKLRHQYGTVAELNRAWGLTYWSHRLSDFSQLWHPDGNTSPQYDLAWRRFQAELTVDFIGWQAGIVAEYASSDQFVTTCIAFDRPAIEDVDLSSVLDVATGNPYYLMQHGLELPDSSSSDPSWTSAGVWALYHRSDRMYSAKQAPFLVTETNAQAIGGPHHNFPAYPGQWRQAGWALAARGAHMVEYWHWHTLHYGTETYWGGVIPHSGKPGRTYAELAALGQEFAAAGEQVAQGEPDADIAIIYSVPSKWALAFQPPLATAAGDGDQHSYERIQQAFYRGAFDAGLQVRIVREQQVFSADPGEFAAQYPVLVAAGLYLLDDDDAAWLSAYARAGGHLVLGPRTGYADQLAQAKAQVAPPGFAAAAGVSYEEFTNLTGPVVVSTSFAKVQAQATVEHFAEGLIPDGAKVLARYEDRFLGRFAAATTQAVGQGQITVVGGVPGREFAQQLAQWLVPEPVAPWQELDAQERHITATSLTVADGRIHVLHNWSWEPHRAQLEEGRQVGQLSLLVGTEGQLAAREVSLGPWDVVVVKETYPPY